MRSTTTGAWVLALVLAGSPASAWNAGYSNGFEPWPEAPRARVRRCPAELDGRTIRASCDWRGRRVRLALQSDQGWDGTLTIGGEAYGSVPEPGGWGAEVYVTDLNLDGRPDYVLVMPGGGAGLAGEHCQVLVAWSGPRRYRIVDFRSLGFGPEDLIDLDGDGRVELVQTAFTRAEASDGQTHGYWVHRLLELDGDRLRPRPGRAPVFIQFTFRRPNHRRAAGLAPVRQRELVTERYLFQDPGGCAPDVDDEWRDRQGGAWTLVESFCRAAHERRFEVFEHPPAGTRRRVLLATRGFDEAPAAAARFVDLEGDGQPEVELSDRCGAGPGCATALFGRPSGQAGPLRELPPAGGKP